MLGEIISNVLSFFEKENKLTWFIAIIGAIIIFSLSSLTFGGRTAGTNIISIIYHITAFFFFTAFLLIAISKGRSLKKLLAGTLFAITYAFTDEIHQYFVPGRSCNLFDIGLDSAGITIALLIYLSVIIYRKNYKKHITFQNKNIYKSKYNS